MADRLYNVFGFTCFNIILKMVISLGFETIWMAKHPALKGDLTRVSTRIKQTHPVTIFFTVIFAGKVWGTIGMFMAVPFLALFRLSIQMWSYSNPDKKEN